MTNSFVRILCILIVSVINLFGYQSFGARTEDSAIGQTQSRRAAQRFDILSWIRDQNATKSAQDAKYGYAKGGSGPYPDLALLYRVDKAITSRDGVEMGGDTRNFGRIQFYLDDIFTRGNKKQYLNVDIGVEGFFSKFLSFRPTPPPRNSHTPTAKLEEGSSYVLLAAAPKTQVWHSKGATWM